MISRFAWAVKRGVAGSALQHGEDRLVHGYLHPSRGKAAKLYPAQLSLAATCGLSVSGRLTTESWPNPLRITTRRLDPTSTRAVPRCEKVRLLPYPGRLHHQVSSGIHLCHQNFFTRYPYRAFTKRRRIGPQTLLLCRRYRVRFRTEPRSGEPGTSNTASCFRDAQSGKDRTLL